MIYVHRHYHDLKWRCSPMRTPGTLVDRLRNISSALSGSFASAKARIASQVQVGKGIERGICSDSGTPRTSTFWWLQDLICLLMFVSCSSLLYQNQHVSWVRAPSSPPLKQFPRSKSERQCCRHPCWWRCPSTPSSQGSACRSVRKTLLLKRKSSPTSTNWNIYFNLLYGHSERTRKHHDVNVYKYRLPNQYTYIYTSCNIFSTSLYLSVHWISMLKRATSQLQGLDPSDFASSRIGRHVFLDLRAQIQSCVNSTASGGWSHHIHDSSATLNIVSNIKWNMINILSSNTTNYHWNIQFLISVWSNYSITKHEDRRVSDSEFPSFPLRPSSTILLNHRSVSSLVAFAKSMIRHLPMKKSPVGAHREIKNEIVRDDGYRDPSKPGWIYVFEDIDLNFETVVLECYHQSPPSGK